MGRSAIIFWLATILVAAGTIETTKLAENIEESSVSFTAKLYSTIIKGKENENIVISPFSIQVAAVLAFIGASGKTAEQMIDGLRLTSDDRNVVATTFNGLIESQKTSPILQIANKLYLRNGFEPYASYLELLSQKFHSEVGYIDVSDAEKSAGAMNQWVEAATNGKIKDLIDPSSLTSITQGFILNAIHFKGSWVQKFPKDKTRKATFWTSDNESVEVDMMYNTGKFKIDILPELDAEAIELPFDKSNISMIVLIPHDKTGLKRLETKLLKENFKLPTFRGKAMKVKIGLPRFQAEFSTKLKETFTEMGMPNMFENAEFGNLCKDYLQVSEIVHKAFIDVNEEGSEAAAGTAVHVTFRSSPLAIIANRPFLYFIRGASGEILFIGRYTKP